MDNKIKENSGRSFILNDRYIFEIWKRPIRFIWKKGYKSFLWFRYMDKVEMINTMKKLVQK